MNQSKLLQTMIAGVVLTASGCATRQVPSSFPPSAPVAPESAPAPLPEVGRVVTEEPPLPGEATDSWSGLAPTTTSPGTHHEH